MNRLPAISLERRERKKTRQIKAHPSSVMQSNTGFNASETRLALEMYGDSPIWYFHVGEEPF